MKLPRRKFRHLEKLGIELKLGSAAAAAAAIATDCPRWIESAKLVKLE